MAVVALFSFGQSAYAAGYPVSFGHPDIIGVVTVDADDDRNYDAEKTSTNTEDDLMCWAASAADVLAWGGWGVPGLDNEHAIFEDYQDHWTDDGGIQEFGWEWWFDGTNPSQGWGSGWSQVDVAGGGNHYPTLTFSNYFHRNGQDDQALSAIDSYLHSGYGVGLAVYTAAGSGHAITAWGYKYFSLTGDYLGVYVTDSDDDKGGAGSSSDLPERLRYYDVTLSSGKWYLDNFYGTSDVWYIGEVQALAPNPTSSSVPEPCSLALLGLGGVGLVALKRRRRRAA